MSEGPASRPPVLTEKDIERLAALMNKGAKVSIQNPDVERVKNWLIGLVGLGLLGSMAWMASSLDSLNRTMERVLTTQGYHENRIQRLEDRKP